MPPLQKIQTMETSQGIAFLVAAGTVYNVVAAVCSSPQTTEINADTRSSTLMKWVNLGLAQSVLFVGAAVVIDKRHRVGIFTGGGVAVALLWWQYIYARNSGLAASAAGTPGTEY